MTTWPGGGRAVQGRNPFRDETARSLNRLDSGLIATALTRMASDPPAVVIYGGRGRQMLPRRPAYPHGAMGRPHQIFFFGRHAGGAASEKTSTSSPVTVEMSWCTLTSFTPTASSTSASSRGRPVAIM